MSNRDIGFVEVGQDAAIKIDTFNFTRYGLLNGKVLTVSQDAITREKPRRQHERQIARRRKLQQRAERPRTNLRCPGIAQPDPDGVENKLVNLSPGMAVTVEIRTGSRSIISYLLSPLIRYKRRACARDERS